MAETLPAWKVEIRKQQAALRDHPGLAMTPTKWAILTGMNVGLPFWIGSNGEFSLWETAWLADMEVDYQAAWQLIFTGMIEVETCFQRRRVYRITDVGKETLERDGAEGAGRRRMDETW